MGEVSVLLFGPLAAAFGISESTQKIESSQTRRWRRRHRHRWRHLDAFCIMAALE